MIVSQVRIREQAANPGLTARFAEVLNKVVFLGLLGVIALTVFPYGTVDPWWEAVFECTVFLLTAFWIIESLLVGNCQVKRLFLMAPLMMITAYAFAQMVEWPP